MLVLIRLPFKLIGVALGLVKLAIKIAFLPLKIVLVILRKLIGVALGLVKLVIKIAFLPLKIVLAFLRKLLGGGKDKGE